MAWLLLWRAGRCVQFDRYNIVCEDDLRMAAQKTTMYVDTLPTKRVFGVNSWETRGAGHRRPQPSSDPGPLTLLSPQTKLAPPVRSFLAPTCWEGAACSVPGASTTIALAQSSASSARRPWRASARTAELSCPRPASSVRSALIALVRPRRRQCRASARRRPTLRNISRKRS